MKFLARGEMAFKDRRYLKQGAAVYVLAKLISMIFYLNMVDCLACAEPKHFLIRSLIHIVLFSHFIFIGLLLAVRILAWTAFFRAVLYLFNVIFNTQYMVDFPLVHFSIEILSHSPYGGWVFLVPALLNGIICFYLVRALVKGRDVRRKKVSEGADAACPFGKHTKEKETVKEKKTDRACPFSKVSENN